MFTYTHTHVYRNLAPANSYRKRDFLDPDFGVKAKLNLADSKQRSRCRLDSEADSEIPELGLDSARLNIDCDINPARVIGAAAKAAQSLGKYREQRRHRKRVEAPTRSGSVVKRKRTRINIDREYERSRDVEPEGQGDEADEAEDDNDD